MIIGKFTYSKASDTYEGFIETTVQSCKLHLRPETSKSEKGPHYRATIESRHGDMEIGAAWKRKSEAGRSFLSVTLDDPFWTRPLHAALMPSDDGSEAILIWSRPAKRKGQAD